MSVARLVVFLPCHTLDDFPSWLEDAEAEDLLAAWVAAWSPELIAGVGGVPSWASVDLAPPQDGPVLGIVPASFDDRFVAQHDAVAPNASRFVRGASGSAAVHASAVEAMRGLGIQTDARGSGPWVDDFRALGLGVLLGELLARRMRSAADLGTTGLVESAVAAASAAVEGRDEEVRARLGECFRCLEAARARYYPVDAWLVDLVLLARSTLGPALRAELSVPTACGVVATGDLVRRLATEEPGSLAMLRRGCADGWISACGGREDERPLEACLPEEIRASFESGISAWREHVGVSPRTFAQVSGGCSAILPQLLQGMGYDGAVLGGFDGTALPAGAAGRIRWEGGGGCIDALARPPLDARRASSILALPNTLGDAMDHDHTAVVMFARHAGTASPWHTLLRRLGGWGSGLGTFVAPDDFFRRTAGAGTLASFAADAFPPSLPPDGRAAVATDPVAVAIAAARGAAAAAAAEQARILPLLAGCVTGQGSLPRATGLVPNPRARVARRASRVASAGRRGWFGFGMGSGDSELILDNGRIRAQVNRKTGGLLSVRGPGDATNRLSQRLAVRGTRPAPAVGRPWESVEERAEYADMRADAIVRMKTAAGDDCVESRGRFIAADGSEQGTFVQRVGLAPDAAVAILDIEVALAGPAIGPLLEHHAACRFAWHENDDMEIRRGVHAQAVVTERSRFTAPHFVTVEATGQRGAERRGVAILTGGLPWHVRSGPHMLDTILVASGGVAHRRLAIGIDVVPWHMALALLADDGFAVAPARAGTARIATGRIETAQGRIIAVTISLIESEGRPCEARLRWHAPPARATASRPGGTMPASASVAVEDRETVVSLQPYEWLDVTVEFER